MISDTIPIATIHQIMLASTYLPSLFSPNISISSLYLFMLFILIYIEGAIKIRGSDFTCTTILPYKSQLIKIPLCLSSETKIAK